MRLDHLRGLARQALASRAAWPILITLYVLVVLFLLAPVLLAPIGGDDGYWVLDTGPLTHGSLWQAFWQPLSVAFDFDFQPRTTALAFSERRILALLTMKTSIYFSIPPFIVWAAVKLALMGLSLAAVLVFLRALRFRDSSGAVRGLQRDTIAFVMIALPLTIAIGAKSQNVRSLNGWNFYPTLAYGPFAFYLLFAAFVLGMSRRLERNYRRWLVPALLSMTLMGVVVNLSYELLALSIPLNVMLLATAPRPAEGSLWQRWRAPFTVGATLALTYTTMFVWIRWQISQMACHASNTCYVGTVIEVRPRTLLNNLLGSLPGGTGDFVRERAELRELPYPGVTPLSVLLPIVATALMFALWAAWKARQDPDAGVAKPGGDHRGTLLVVAVGIVIALGSAVVTGINANAVQQLDTPMLSYRSNVVTWSALAMAGLAVVRLLVTRAWAPLRVGALAALTALIVVSIAVNQPRNVFSANDDRIGTRSAFTDSLHREVAVADPSRAGDARRCTIITTLLKRLDVVDPRTQRTINGAYAAYEFYHHEPFCSTGAGDPAPVDQPGGSSAP
ncbi:hypothetical protein [Aeromicrobium sp. 9AM]|uniref:hypothetical protein n=1 Tax=Aeromicrobium sp. 9AM TaxID=2653126 RepID=UPI0012EF8AC2|nr:hypothetical protein [Aeromicrobium sp. 9AM]VXC35627.1 membrane hypothetical protein [Aeromicrobium sp. 9AM]